MSASPGLSLIINSLFPILNFLAIPFEVQNTYNKKIFSSIKCIYVSVYYYHHEVFSKYIFLYFSGSMKFVN